tara:strand:+ start:594 stop:827 length:234 start_codon:yes stop_codon:yes gene_type:complete
MLTIVYLIVDHGVFFYASQSFVHSKERGRYVKVIRSHYGNKGILGVFTVKCTHDAYYPRDTSDPEYINSTETVYKNV